MTNQPQTFNEACQQIANELVELICQKQHDYGHDNIKAFGEMGLIIRVNDKLARLRNLQGKEGKTEPRVDSWQDIAGYALIALMLDRDWFKLDLLDLYKDSGTLIITNSDCAAFALNYKGKDRK